MDNIIIEEKPDHSFRTETPNIIWELGLNSQERDLYSYYKKVAGDHGQCFKSRKKIQEETGISVSKQKEINKKLRQPQDLLGGKALIRIYQSRKENGGNNPTQILIVDIWRENGDYFRSKKQHEPLGQKLAGGGQDLAEGGPGAGAKEEPIKNNPLKKKKNKQKKEKSGGSPPEPPSCSEVLIERCDFVHTTKKEHERLVDEFGESMTQRAYERLSEWKLEKPKSKRGTGSDNLRLRRWVFKSLREDDIKEAELELREKRLKENKLKDIPKDLHHMFDKTDENSV